MKIEVGKTYICKNKLKVKIDRIDSDGDYIGQIVTKNPDDEHAGTNFYYKETGVRYPGTDEFVDNPFTLTDEWSSETIPKQIDQLSYLDFRKGIDKLWKMGRAF